MDNFHLAKQYFLDGCIFLEKNDFYQAEDKFKKSLELIPDRASTLTNLSVAQLKLNKYSEARDTLQKVILLQTDNSEAYLNFGLLEKDLENYEVAIEFFDKAISIRPNYSEAFSNKGNVLKQLKRFEEAMAHYDRALILNPNSYQAWTNMGVALHQLKDFDEAIAHFDKAISLKPDYYEAWANKGNALHQLKHFDEAIAHFNKAISLKYDYYEAWTNRGVVHHELKHFDEAIADFDKAISLKPGYCESLWNKSLTLLLQGDYETGFLLYESRWGSKDVSEVVGKRYFHKPTWLGIEPLKDKTILLYGEQGLGDFIQFCRYVKLVSNLGAKVILEVPRPLVRLMERLDGVSQLVISGEALPFFDFQCPLMSLPFIFKTTLDSIPNPQRYIHLDSCHHKISEWKARLGPKLKPRVGLVWSGNPHHKNDHNRSLFLADLLPFLPVQFEYISLQKEIRAADQLILDANPRIISFSSHLIDFHDTAALIQDLDLVITVDTSVAHLSGALGKKTLLLLPFVPDWRWLLDREDSPWYSSIKLFRQTTIGDWSSALGRIKFYLSHYRNS